VSAQRTDHSESPKLKTDNLEHGAIGFAVIVVGHGAYLAYHYFRYHSVNTISLALLILVASVAAVLVLLIFLAKHLNRSDEKQRGSPS
jgi:hypothetical protein